MKYHVIKALVLNFFILAALALLAWALAGCTAARTNQSRSAESVAASHDATIRRAVTGPVTPNITVSGSSNVVTVTPAQSHTDAAVTDQAETRGEASGENRSTFRFGIPLAVALGGVCFGVAALLVAYVVWSRGSAAGRAADAGFSAAIDHVQSGGGNVLALLEKHRGKIR